MVFDFFDLLLPKLRILCFEKHMFWKSLSIIFSCVIKNKSITVTLLQIYGFPLSFKLKMFLSIIKTSVLKTNKCGTIVFISIKE